MVLGELDKVRVKTARARVAQTKLAPALPESGMGKFRMDEDGVLQRRGIGPGERTIAGVRFAGAAGIEKC
ncbi:MAG TPA: hypothetical protein VGE76_07480, partial [Opitutaceae bacterium]